jgi:hypothetical protein
MSAPQRILGRSHHTAHHRHDRYLADAQVVSISSRREREDDARDRLAGGAVVCTMLF